MTDVVEQPQSDGTLLLRHPTKPWSLLWYPQTKTFTVGYYGAAWTFWRVNVWCDPNASLWFTPVVTEVEPDDDPHDCCPDDWAEEQTEAHSAAEWMTAVIGMFGAENTMTRSETIIGGHRTLIEPCVAGLNTPGVRFTNLDMPSVSGKGNLDIVRHTYSNIWTATGAPYRCLLAQTGNQKVRVWLEQDGTLETVKAVSASCEDEQFAEDMTRWVKAVQNYAATHYPIPMEETND